MNDVYKFAKPNTLDLIQRSAGLDQLVKELHAVYGVYPYNSDKESVSLIYPNGLMFGLASTFINSESRTVYKLRHDKISVGRGNSRNSRQSTSLKSMIKLLKKDIPTIPPSFHELKGNLKRIKGRITNMVYSHINTSVRTSVHIRDEEIAELVLHIVDKQSLSQNVYDKLINYREDIRRQEDRAQQLKERLTYFDNIYILYTSNWSPTIFAEMTKTKQYIDGKVEDVYRPVGDWKIANDLNDIPDAALSLLKMWEVANEKDIKPERPWGVDETPVTRFLVNQDKFYPDYDVITRYDPFDGYRDYFVAVAKGPSSERSN